MSSQLTSTPVTVNSALSANIHSPRPSRPTLKWISMIDEGSQGRSKGATLSVATNRAVKSSAAPLETSAIHRAHT